MNSMTHDECYLEKGDRRLFRQWWLPKTEGVPKAIVLICHGLNEHSGRYEEVARSFTSAGLAVYAMDHWGHGRSDGIRGYIPNYMVLVRDFSEFVAYVNALYPTTKMFLLGHSMGGAVALNVASLQPERWSGVLLSAPCLELSSEGWKHACIGIARKILPSKVLSFLQFRPVSAIILVTADIIGWFNVYIKKRVASTIGRFAPTMPCNKIDPSTISRNPAVVQKYIDDPLNVKGLVTAGTSREIIRLADKANKLSWRYLFPISIYHGTADALTCPRASERLIAHVPSHDRYLKIYPELYHEILQEDEGPVVMQHMLDWILQRV